MNLIRDIMELGRSEDTWRQSEESYGRSVESYLDIGIKHASGRCTCAHAARAKLRDRQVALGKRALRRVRPYRLEKGTHFTHVWLERKGAGTCEEMQVTLRVLSQSAS